MCKHYISFKAKGYWMNCIDWLNMHKVDQFKVKLAHHIDENNVFSLVLLDDKYLVHDVINQIKRDYDREPFWSRVNDDFNIGDDIECTEMI